MKNLKIRVNNEAESREIQNIFESAGFRKWIGWSELGSIGGFIWTDSDMTYCDNGVEYFDESPREEITLPELRAMVNPMKEYLDSNRNYEFVLSTEKDDGFIEIPEGAIRARFYPNDPDALEFEGDFCQWWHDKDNEWINYENYSNTLEHSRVVWQRDQDEPFLTPECTLNDQYAEIEQVRQVEIHGTVKAEPDLTPLSFGAKDNVNHPSHYADSAIECIDAMEAMMTAEQFIGYLRGNLFKYQWRYEKKNGIEDLKKAQWYLEKLTVKVAEKNAPF